MDEGGSTQHQTFRSNTRQRYNIPKDNQFKSHKYDTYVVMYFGVIFTCGFFSFKFLHTRGSED